MNSLIEIHNFGRGTKVVVCGIELGRAAEGFSFDQFDKEKPMLFLNLDVNELERAIASLTDEDIANILAVARPLIEEKRKNDIEDRITIEKVKSILE